MTTWGHERAFSWRGANPYASSLRREGVRRQVVALVFLVFWMVVLEGAVRKWLLPDLHRVVLFARDPILLLAYLNALRGGFLRPSDPLCVFAIAFSIGTPFLLLVQLTTSSYVFDPVLAGYGWRNYVLYGPLLHVIAAAFRREDLDRLCRHVLLLAAFSAPLMAVQVRSDFFHPINMGTGDNDETTFANLGLALGIVRATGFFTSSNGAYIFSVTAFAVGLGFWLRSPKERGIHVIWLLVGTAAAIVCVFLSGNRGSVVHVGIILLFGFAAAGVLVARSLIVRSALVPFVLAAAAGAALTVLFPDVFEAFVVRFTSAQIEEEQSYALGIVGRAFRPFTSFIPALAETPLFGYGLGYGTNAAVLLDLLPDYLQAEDDWHRHVVDLGGPLASILIFLRIVLVAYIGVLVFRALRRTSDPMPLVLFGLIGIVLLAGQIVGHSTLNAFAWIFTGVCCGLAKAAESATWQRR